jgi:hypothetical protein
MIDVSKASNAIKDIGALIELGEEALNLGLVIASLFHSGASPERLAEVAKEKATGMAAGEAARRAANLAGPNSTPQRKVEALPLVSTVRLSWDLLDMSRYEEGLYITDPAAPYIFRNKGVIKSTLPQRLTVLTVNSRPIKVGV